MKLQIPPALRHRKFAAYWAGLLFAWIGNQMLIWTIPWQIRDFTDNPLALGVIGLIRLAPTILFSLFAGIASDRFNRRKVLLVTQSVMGATALTLALLTLSGRLQLWHIYVLLVIHATTFIFDLPARYSLTPNLVPADVLPNALSVEIIGVQIGGVFGPIFSGLLIQGFGEQAAYLTSAVFFGVFAVMLLRMGDVSQQRLVSQRKGIDWAAIREGVRFTFQQPLILAGMILDFLATLLTRADSLMPYFARDILGVDGAAYGLLSAASMIGAVTAGLVISQIAVLHKQGKLLLTSIAMIGVAAVVFGFSRNFYLSVAALMLAGAADSVSSIIRSAIRQLHTPDRLRGRMTSVNQIFFMGGPYLGDVKSGFLGGVVGVPLAVALGGFACILSAGWAARQWPQMRLYDGGVGN
ncbi:MAG: MFS transporter [Anaerolineae bacterium]|nr:MFS transporter [Anaerolineae bacterium]MBL6966409.1 MFS transporter [Anaerolineales bacterium]